MVLCYADPIDVLFDALGSLLLQCHRERLVVVVAFEARTPDLAAKEAAVLAAFTGALCKGVPMGVCRCAARALGLLFLPLC